MNINDKNLFNVGDVPKIRKRKSSTIIHTLSTNARHTCKKKSRKLRKIYFTISFLCNSIILLFYVRYSYPDIKNTKEKQ